MNKNVSLAALNFVGVFKILIPCTYEFVQLVEQIINEIYKIFNPTGKQIDLGPLQILLLLLNLFTLNSQAIENDKIKFNKKVVPLQSPGWSSYKVHGHLKLARLKTIILN